MAWREKLRSTSWNRSTAKNNSDWLGNMEETVLSGVGKSGAKLMDLGNEPRS